jgi:signal transduction histidine kinase/HAMP domain-containing protein
MKISIKIIVLLEVLLIGSIGIIGFFASISGTQAINTRIEDQLESVVTLKQYYLANHIEETEQKLRHLSKHITTAMNNQSNYHLFIRETMQSYLDDADEFTEFFILDYKGVVQISTNTDHERKIRSNENYFQYGKNNSYIQSFYYDLFIKNTSIIFSLPIKGKNDELLGVLAGRGNVNLISDIIDDVSGLGNTGETFLVNGFNYLISDLRKQESESLKKNIHTPIVEYCLDEKPVSFSFYDSYYDYNNDLVIGGSLFIPELNAGLIAKIDQNEAYASLYVFSSIISFICICAISAITLLVYYFIKRITRQIVILDSCLKKISKGNLSSEISINSNDEIGSLAKSFNTMKLSLIKSKDELLKYQHHLEEKVEMRTKDLHKKISALEKSEFQNQQLLTELRHTKFDLEQLNETLEQKVIDRTEEVQSLLKQKDEFIGQLGHDLKNPLGPLIQLLPIIEKQEQDTKKKEILVIVNRNVVYMKNLVTKTLELARLNSPNTKFNYELISIKEELNSILNSNRFIFDEKNMKINDNITDNLIVYADKLRIEELFTNLLNNAVKYSENDGTITINAEKKDHEILFSVQDEGIGMTSEQIERMFDEFYKADSSRHDFDSSGLGMSIAKRIVEKHGGRIWVESNGLGKGSTFYFTIPYNSR